MFDEPSPPTVRSGIRQDARKSATDGAPEWPRLKRQVFRIQCESPAMTVPQPGPDIGEFAIGPTGRWHDDPVTADEVRGAILAADMDIDVRGHRGSVRAGDAHG